MSTVTLISKDRMSFNVGYDVALRSGLFRQIFEKNYDVNEMEIHVNRIDGLTLGTVIEYCTRFKAPQSDGEGEESLPELTNEQWKFLLAPRYSVLEKIQEAADYLGIPDLSNAVWAMISDVTSGMSDEEMEEYFGHGVMTEEDLELERNKSGIDEWTTSEANEKPSQGPSAQGPSVYKWSPSFWTTPEAKEKSAQGPSAQGPSAYKWSLDFFETLPFVDYAASEQGPSFHIWSPDFLDSLPFVEYTAFDFSPSEVRSRPCIWDQTSGQECTFSEELQNLFEVVQTSADISSLDYDEWIRCIADAWEETTAQNGPY